MIGSRAMRRNPGGLWPTTGSMRSLFCLISIAATAACTTKPTAGVCCVTDADCARLGVDEPRPCEVGQACKAFECVAAECASSAECPSPDAPVCVDSLCVATCRTDDDCAGAAGGLICADDGACVGCLGDADCPASAPFCDAEDRRCRGCELDAECASGVCLEMDGRCATPGELVHVQEFGSDAGDCTSVAPCRTLSYALQKVTPSRQVIHIIGGNLTTLVTTTAIDRPVVIDGSDTAINKPPSGPLFSIGAAVGTVTLEGMTLLGSSALDDPTITVASGSLVRVGKSVLNTALIDLANGGLELRDVRLTAVQPMRGVICSNGTVSARTVEFEHTSIRATNCQLNVAQSRFEEINDGSINASGGFAIVENNLVVQAYELADTMYLTNMAPGSTVRFNTFVNTSGVDASGTALYCDATVDVTSNIFAYGSTHPHGGATACRASYSLYDLLALPEQVAGIGNLVADGATFFVSRGNRDFHLAPGCPARSAAEPGTGVTRDLEGRPRPNPISSVPDMGAFEAP